MCRIVGIADFKEKLGAKLEPLVISMRDSMLHGGPDDAGIYISEDKKIALGHRRLSIIDLSSSGHQPMANSDKTIWITYNGEIYNFQELRGQLADKGYKFQSKSDTEVIIYGYEEWGIEGLLLRLRGMFAFAIYDSRETQGGNRLILARDRLGIKPLYYYLDDEKLIFASEVKAIVKNNLVSKSVNEEAMVKFLQLGSVPAPMTTIKNIFSLPAASYMIVDERSRNIKQYWNLLDCFKISTLDSFDEAANEARDLLLDVAKIHLVSDAPLGVFLSGGIDSSSLVALASGFRDMPLKTLSVIFQEKDYSEAHYAKEVAKKYNTEHHEVLLSTNDFQNELPLILKAMDQPTVDGVNTYFIAKAAKEVGLKVVLSGIGGDEIFMGYSYFKKANILNFARQALNALPPFARKGLVNSYLGMEKLTGRIAHEKLCYMANPTNENSYLMFRGLFTPEEIQRAMGMSTKELETLASFTLSRNLPLALTFNLLDFKHYLQNQLLKDADFMGMRHSVEIRVPFLDHILVEKILSLNPSLKLSNGVNKPLLVKAMGEALPKSVYKRTKMGFTFPFEKWIYDNWENMQEISLLNNNLEQKFVKKIWNDFKDGKVHWSRVWALVVLGNF
ncbi:MAG: asparagine synthase (glutamine-hydrolyzing) [Candidatus Melainabacteria bacterium]|nr:asparagine synthase (glutamine-hydrolyzing) [Candidatus Melainabacteria bacterium]